MYHLDHSAIIVQSTYLYIICSLTISRLVNHTTDEAVAEEVLYSTVGTPRNMYSQNGKKIHPCAVILGIPIRADMIM